jgi:hypothetical protein
MEKVYSIDLMINDSHSADAIYQDCLYKCFTNNFNLITSSKYKVDDKHILNILEPITNRNPLKKLLILFKNAKTIFNITRINDDFILIYQSFFSSEIIITIFIFLLNKITFSNTRITIGLIMRFEFSKFQKKIFPFFVKILPKTYKLVLFTDTTELQLIHQKFLRKKVTLLPIPHTFPCDCLNNNDKILKIGFPGFPRKEKGIELIEKIINNLQTKNIVFNLQDWQIYKSTFSNIENVNLDFKTITRNDYTSYVCSCDLIILPYTNSNYLNRSSGIFAESLFAKKIVLVSNNTWMSKQLQMMGLNYFVVSDFNNTNEFQSKIMYIANNLIQIKEEFAFKSKSFFEFHNQSVFNSIFLENLKN